MRGDVRRRRGVLKQAMLKKPSKSKPRGVGVDRSVEGGIIRPHSNGLVADTLSLHTKEQMLITLRTITSRNKNDGGSKMSSVDLRPNEK
jgi:hypothetical protein